MLVVPTNGFAQTGGAKSVKSSRKGGKSKSTNMDYNSRKRRIKKVNRKQGKATKRRNKMINKNAMRRQKGRLPKSTRLV